MKHFWVIFKLMLLLVFALRLLKSNRKVTKNEHDSNCGFFNLFQKKVFSEKIQIEFESATPDLQLKEIFRKNIRPKEENWKQNGSLYDDFFASLSIEERLIYIAIIFDKNFQKGSIFHFLWHKTEWIIAFGQSLKYIQAKGFYAHYQQVMLEITGFDLETIATENNDFFPLDLHPDGSQVFDSVKRFDKEFDRNIFYQLIISFTFEKQT
ncbi:hypothetical protein [Emticicia sp.]|uniref:hypothetical protein n=1 Tax=Emticicia sp. TaxID=1930953 RepID=UPI003753BAED